MCVKHSIGYQFLNKSLESKDLATATVVMKLSIQKITFFYLFGVII